MSIRVCRVFLIAFYFFVGVCFTPLVRGDDSCFELLDDAQAIECLPRFEQNNYSILPSWGRALAKNNPYLTAAMLEFDHLVRSQESEMLRLASLARLGVAQVNNSEYGLAYAQFDLSRAGASELVTITPERQEALSNIEKNVYRFARQMTLAGRDVQDTEIEQLREQLGNERLVGLILMIGYGNLQDRLVHAIGLTVEKSGPLQPQHWVFLDATPNGRNTPSQPRVDEDTHSGISPGIGSDSWYTSLGDELTFASIESKLDLQRTRKTRIEIPSWEEIQSKLPAGLYPKPLRIRWSRVVVGYQPKIGPAWIKCLRVFEQEAHQNRVFEESVFWIVTRGLRCFYCMGHCEMLMEVGGLKPDEIRERTRQLSTGDWRQFSDQEQIAFRYAYKMTNKPSEMSCEDYRELTTHLGESRAIDCIWWIARCQFMTKVSDALQLQLETENVFAD